MIFSAAAAAGRAGAGRPSLLCLQTVITQNFTGASQTLSPHFPGWRPRPGSRPHITTGTTGAVATGPAVLIPAEWAIRQAAGANQPITDWQRRIWPEFPAEIFPPVGT